MDIYDNTKFKWLAEHVSDADFFESIDDYALNGREYEAFEDYVEECGFHGAIWPSLDEAEANGELTWEKPTKTFTEKYHVYAGWLIISGWTSFLER